MPTAKISEREPSVSVRCTTRRRGEMHFTLHQDTPVLPPNMLETIWCAVNRISREGVSMGEAQRIAPEQALRAVTLDAAYPVF